MSSSAADLRRTAHHISDLIFEKLTGPSIILTESLFFPAGTLVLVNGLERDTFLEQAKKMNIIESAPNKKSHL